jgi:hypothetical protein
MTRLSNPLALYRTCQSLRDGRAWENEYAMPPLPGTEVTEIGSQGENGVAISIRGFALLLVGVTPATRNVPL